MYFLVNASPSPIPLEVATSNFVPAIRSHEVEDIGQHFV